MAAGPASRVSRATPQWVRRIRRGGRGRLRWRRCGRARGRGGPWIQRTLPARCGETAGARMGPLRRLKLRTRRRSKRASCRPSDHRAGRAGYRQAFALRWRYSSKRTVRPSGADAGEQEAEAGVVLEAGVGEGAELPTRWPRRRRRRRGRRRHRCRSAVRHGAGGRGLIPAAAFVGGDAGRCGRGGPGLRVWCSRGGWSMRVGVWCRRGEEVGFVAPVARMRPPRSRKSSRCAGRACGLRRGDGSR